MKMGKERAREKEDIKMETWREKERVYQVGDSLSDNAADGAETRELDLCECLCVCTSKHFGR